MEAAQLIAHMISVALAALLTCAAALALHHITQPQPLPSSCPGLIEIYQATGVPVHIQIKCKDFLK
jgi:hypothetical protein